MSLEQLYFKLFRQPASTWLKLASCLARNILLLRVNRYVRLLTILILSIWSTWIYLSAQPPQREPKAPAMNPALNVRNFGAKGDGIADDRAAIQAAINEAHRRGGGTV